MEFPKFGNHIKELRSFRSKTVYEVATAIGVSHTYISQMENGKKLPSLKVLFPLVEYLGSKNDKGYINKMKNSEHDGTELLKEYADYKNISSEDLLYQYMEYLKDISINHIKEFSKSIEARRENKVEISRANKKVTVTNKPYFDLKWLLIQEDFFVLYGHEYDLQNVLEKKGSISDTDLYNVLLDEDIKTIYSLIEAYLSNKYEKVKK